MAKKKEAAPVTPICELARQPIPPTARTKIAELLEKAPEKLHRWTARTKAAFLAGYRLGLGLASALAAKLGITGVVRSKWSVDPPVIRAYAAVTA